MLFVIEIYGWLNKWHAHKKCAVIYITLLTELKTISPVAGMEAGHRMLWPVFNIDLCKKISLSTLPPLIPSPLETQIKPVSWVSEIEVPDNAGGGR